MSESKSEQKIEISLQTTIAELLRKFPAAIEFLSTKGLSYIGCNANYQETLQEAFERANVEDKEKELSNLKAFLEKRYGNISSIEPINITAKAAKKVKEIMKANNIPENSYLRIAIVAAGCAGFSYELTFAKEKKENELSFKVNDINVLVPKEDLELLKGSTVDFIESLQVSGFKIINPNVNNTCSCGQSFCC